MSEPVDPNSAPGPWQPVTYEPPPPFAPPQYASNAPGSPAPPDVGSVWIMGPDGVLVPAPPPSPEPPSHRRRNLVITLAAVAVVTLAALGAATVFSDDGSSPARLSIPSSFDGYSHVNGSVARQVESTIRGMAGSATATASMFNAATIGSYAKNSGDQPRLILLVLRTSEVPSDVGQSPDEIAHGLMAIAGNKVSDYAAGVHGGSSACADTQFGAVTETMCAWSDPATTGMIVSVATPMTPSGLSAIELDLRDLVD